MFRIATGTTLAMLGIFFVGLLLSLAGSTTGARFWSLLGSKEILFAIKLSLFTATLATAAAVLLALPAAYALSHYRFPGKSVVDTLLDLPIVLSPIALGAALMVFSGTGLGKAIEGHLLTFVFEVPGLVLAQFTVVVALATRLLKSTFDMIDPRYVSVSRALGRPAVLAPRRDARPARRDQHVRPYLREDPVHGVVPVHEDGSAYFSVPADKNLFFQALDENYMEVQRMRTFVDFQPGESRSCIGCHQHRGLAPPPEPALALRYPPAKPGAQPGEVVPRPLYYPTDVQPILDKHCVGCHNTTQADGDLDLSGELTTYFSRSYENLMRKKLVAYVQEFVGPQPRAQKTNVVPLPPKALGSHASKLIGLIHKGHYDAELSPEELIRLITWADANAPYYGSYFGRRNLIYKNHPDFRPLPRVKGPPTAPAVPREDPE